jgi:putative hydrolase of the HAD superfamily
MTLTILREEAFRDAPELVVFDLDNTLYEYEPAHRAALLAAERKVCALLGADAGRFRDEFAAARDAVKKRLRGTASSHSRLLYFQTLLERMGLESQILLSLDLEQTYWRAFLSNAKLFPDVTEWLRDLQANGVGTALLTDLTAQIQFRKLIYFGLDQQFKFVVTSEEAGADKPARGPFELLLSKAGIKDPSKAWMVGDSPEADVEGARAAGLVTLQKLNARFDRASKHRGADLRFEHFADLRRLCHKRFGIGQMPGMFPVSTSLPEASHA